LYGIHDQKTWI